MALGDRIFGQLRLIAGVRHIVMWTYYSQVRNPAVLISPFGLGRSVYGVIQI